MQQGQTQQQPEGRGQAPGGPGQQAQGGRGGGRGYDGMPVDVPDEFDADPIMALGEPELVKILNDSSSTTFQKAMACKKLATIGTNASVAPMAALLSDEHLNCYARFGMEPMPDPAVDAAFRDALGRLKGRVLMGVIHSIGVRKDAQAVPALGKLVYDSDPEIAQASAASLAMIGGAQPAKLLQEAVSKTQMPVFPVVARAALVCAWRLAATDRDTARQMYNALIAANMPKPVRKAAYRQLLVLDTPDDA